MSIISERQAEQLRAQFQAAGRAPVTILFFPYQAAPGEPSGGTSGEAASEAAGELAQASDDARALLREVVALAPAYLTLEELDLTRDAAEAQTLGIERTPAFTLRGQAAGLIRTFGVPSNYEFTTLIDDLLALVAGGHTTLDESVRESLSLLRRPAHLQVFVAPT